MAQSQRLIDGLKRELKLRGVTYRALASELGVAESTIKRGFASGRFDFDRLDAICELLSLELEDLVRPPDSSAAGLERLPRGSLMLPAIRHVELPVFKALERPRVAHDV